MRQTVNNIIEDINSGRNYFNPSIEPYQLAKLVVSDKIPCSLCLSKPFNSMIPALFYKIENDGGYLEFKDPRSGRTILKSVIQRNAPSLAVPDTRGTDHIITFK